jgi:hypothetical protein
MTPFGSSKGVISLLSRCWRLRRSKNLQQLEALNYSANHHTKIINELYLRLSPFLFLGTGPDGDDMRFS